MQQVIFDALKYTITMVLVLIFSDTSVLFCIKADSSDFTTREVFSQVSKEDDKWHLAAFLNKFLFLVVCNYEIYDKKILVIIYA